MYTHEKIKNEIEQAQASHTLTLNKNVVETFNSLLSLNPASSPNDLIKIIIEYARSSIIRIAIGDTNSAQNLFSIDFDFPEPDFDSSTIKMDPCNQLENWIDPFTQLPALLISILKNNTIATRFLKNQMDLKNQTDTIKIEMERIDRFNFKAFAYAIYPIVNYKILDLYFPEEDASDNTNRDIVIHSNGLTLLQMAAFLHNDELMTYLISKKADINSIRTAKGSTLLDQAVLQNDPTLAALVLKHGIKIDFMDNARQLAEERGHVKISQLIIEKIEQLTKEMWNAILGGNRTRVKEILDLGLNLAQANLKLENENVFNLARQKAGREMITFIAEQCPSLLRFANRNGRTLIDDAFDNPTVVRSPVTSTRSKINGELDLIRRDSKPDVTSVDNILTRPFEGSTFVVLPPMPFVDISANELDLSANNNDQTLEPEQLTKCLQSSTYTSLNLSGRQFTSSTVKSIGDIIGNTPSLSSLNLTDCNLDDELLPLFLQGLRQNNNLRHLILANNPLNAVALKTLAELLPDLSIETLNMESNNLSEGDVLTLANALPNSRVSTLDLSNASINNKALMALAQNPTLTDLELWEATLVDNKSEDEGIQCLTLALRENRTLLKLGLGNTGFGVEGAKALSDLLVHNRTLTSLTIKFNAIGDEGFAYLTKVLSSSNHTLTALNCEVYHVTNTSLNQLQDLLHNNRALTFIGLPHITRMTNKETAELLTAFESNRSITELASAHSFLNFKSTAEKERVKCILNRNASALNNHLA